MRLGILGPLEVVGDDGGRIDPAAARQRRLLLALLVWREHPVSVDRLVDVLWSDAALPRDPVRALRTYVTRLRSILEPGHVGGQPDMLVGSADHYTLRLGDHTVDADSFERDLAEAVKLLRDDPQRALACLDVALARWRGPALMEVAAEHWAMPEAVRLDELRLTAVEHRFACLLETGGHLEVVAELERHVREHPLRERPHGLLMVALDRCGRAAEAADAFRSFREQLAHETGLDPSGDLQQLHERLLRASGTTVFTEAAWAGTWNALPPTRSTLIGREADVAAVCSLLSTHRVVTLTGVGGVGKTRLAIEVARTMREHGRPVAFVDLGRITDGSDTVDAVFGALRLPAVARADTVEGLVRVLGSRPGLLVLDNCEHVLDAVASVVEHVAGACPALTMLATSREPIGLDSERVHRVPSLDAVAGEALFVDRAAAVGGAPGPDPSELRHIRDICQRLDGIPLAIELAATRVDHLSPAEIVGRLDERFWLLTGGRRALPRHQTLRAAIDWSYDLLDEEQQLTLRSAAVFVDGFDVQALAAVIHRSEQTTIDLLGSLVGKSLVGRSLTHADAGGGRTRFQLLETVRLYALDRLREADGTATCRAAHARHFLARALAHGPRIGDLPPGGGRETMCRIRLEPIPIGGEPDLGNYVAALDWFARGGDLAAVGRLAARLATVLGYRGFLDPDRRYLGRDDVITAESDPSEQAMYETASALHATYFADWRQQLRFGRAAMVSATDPATRAAATALTAQASLVFACDQVPDLVDGALREAPRDARFTRLLVRGMDSLALVMQGRLREAVERLEIHAAQGDVFAASEQVVLLHILGEDDRALAVPLPQNAEPEHRALWSYRWPLSHALAAAAKGQHTAAGHFLVEAARQTASSPVPMLHRDILLGCAATAYHAGDHGRALLLLSATGGRMRSPATLRLHRHYADLLAQRVDGRAATSLPVEEIDPRRLLEQALADLQHVS